MCALLVSQSYIAAVKQDLNWFSVVLVTFRQCSSLVCDSVLCGTYFVGLNSFLSVFVEPVRAWFSCCLRLTDSELKVWITNTVVISGNM